MSKYCDRAFEFRASETGDGRELTGYAAVFDSPTEINSWEGNFIETISRGAFAKTIQEQMPVMQFDHGRDTRTGSVPIGAIRELREDDHGLFVRADMFDNPVVEPIRQAIAGGAIDGMSFRFRVIQEQWTDGTGKPLRGSEVSSLLFNPGSRGPLRRQVNEVECPELGPVVFPAYDATMVGVRSLMAGLEAHERESLLRDLAVDLQLRTEEPDAIGTTAYLHSLMALRAGKTLSSDTMSTLQKVLDLVAGADDNVDEAQVLLSDLMGVPNPDAADEGTSDETNEAGRTATSALDAATRSRALRELQLRRSA